MLLTTHVIPTHSAFLISHLVLVCYACLNLKALFLSKRHYTLLGETKSYCASIQLFFKMAAFDADLNEQNPIPDPIPDPNRMAFLENQFQYLIAEVSHLRGLVHQPPPPPPQQPFYPNLNLHQPPPFSGIPSELPMFKLKLCQFLMGNYNTYSDNETHLLFAGSLLVGSAGQWCHSLIDPHTVRLPSSYTLC